jgi:hypothetical protein
MAVTEFKRKARRNVTRPVNRQQVIKQLLWKPEIKKVDIEAIKAEFAANKAVSN